MKAVQVVAGVDELSAGPSYSVPRLAEALTEVGVEAPLHCVAGWRGAAPRADVRPAPHRHRQDFAGAPLLGSLCLSGDLHRALRREAADAGVFHTHGLWLAPNLYSAWVARAAGRPLVISTRGMLGEAALGFSSLRKRLAWGLAQGRAARSAACLHATSDRELAEIRAFGLTAPVAVIPNGVEVSSAPKLAGRRGAERTLITVGRIHPIKGLPDLIQAWARLAPAHPDWRLRIVGPDEQGHAAELHALIAGLAVERVTIEPPLFGPAREQALADADLFVLATLNENFAMTVAEALAAGVPVISTKGAPWSGLEANGCGWWVDNGAEALAAALARAMALPRQDLAARGLAGRAWMARDFSWTHVASEMAAVYRWLTGAGPQPDSVTLAR